MPWLILYSPKLSGKINLIISGPDKLTVKHILICDMLFHGDRLFPTEAVISLLSEQLHCFFSFVRLERGTFKLLFG